MADTPFIYCRIVAQYPKTCFLVTLSVHLLVLGVTIWLALVNFDYFSVHFDVIPLDDWSVPWRRRELAWFSRRDEDAARYVRAMEERQAAGWVRSSNYGKANLLLNYDAGDANVFTKRDLQLMKHVEDTLTASPDYNSYCVLDHTLTCTKPLSIQRMFDGTYASINPVFNDTSFDNIAKVLHATKTCDETKSTALFFWSKDSFINDTTAFAHLTRTLIPLGYPLNFRQEREVMESELQDFLASQLKPLIEELNESIDAFDIIYDSYLLAMRDVSLQTLHDSRLLLGLGVLFIFVYTLCHTSSVWISTFGIMSIISSFLGTNLIYIQMLDFRYFGLFHIVILFIMLGIGVDDIYVFLDVWRTTAFQTHTSLGHRLTTAYTKSARSMLFTSLTTAVAFSTSSFSSLLPIFSFGIFAGIMVIVNYISVIVFIPTVVIIHHIYFKHWHWPCRCLPNHMRCLFRETTQRCKNDRTVDYNTDSRISTYDSHVDLDTTDEPNRMVCAASHLTPMPYTVYKPRRFVPYLSETYVDNRKFKAVKLQKTGKVEQPLSTYSLAKTVTAPRSIYALQSGKACQYVNCENRHVNILEWNDMYDKHDTIDTNTRETRSGIDTGHPFAIYSLNKLAGRPAEKKRLRRESSPKNITTSQCKVITKETPFLVRFLRDHYFSLMTRTTTKFIILLIFIPLAIFMAYSAATLEPQNDKISLFRPEHNYAKALELVKHGFIVNELDSNIDVYIIWGLLERDVSGCHFTDVACHGQARYDETFDPNTQAAQLAMLGFCETLSKLAPESNEDLYIRLDSTTGRPQISCFMHNLQLFLQKESKMTGIDWTLPWDYNKTMAFMQARSHYYDTTKFNDSFTDYLQIAISYWLNDGYTFRNVSDFDTYNSLLGERPGPFSTPLNTDNGVVYGNQIRYIGVEVHLKLTKKNNYDTAIHVRDRWEEFIQTKMVGMPRGLANGFQVSGMWTTLTVQETLEADAELGIIVGMVVALPILIMATQNVIIGVVATLSFACSIICVIGLTPLSGDKQDIIVSLSMCLVSGLTSDYIIHMAEGYRMSARADRKSRVQDMLGLMGTSVLSGAITTLGASAFMLFSQLTFLFRFGMFMVTTIGFSLVFSLVFFTTLMGIIGPSGTTGDIKAIFQKLRSCIMKGRTTNRSTDANTI